MSAESQCHHMVVWPHRVLLQAPCGMCILVCMSHYARWWPALTHMQAFNVPALCCRSMGKPLYTSATLHCHHVWLKDACFHTCRAPVLLCGGLDTPVHIPAMFQGSSVLKHAVSHCCYVSSGVCLLAFWPCPQLHCSSMGIPVCRPVISSPSMWMCWHTCL